MHEPNCINKVFGCYSGCVVVVNRYDEVLYANPSAIRLLCRMRDSGGYLPSVLRLYEGRYAEVCIHDIVGDEVILEVDCSSIVWKGQAAKLQIMVDRTDAVRRQRELERLVYLDELTGLSNRRGLEQRIKSLFVHATSLDKKVNVIFIDVNELKAINDNFGHHTGDRALLEASDIISQSCGESAITARIGGDEFVVVHLAESEPGLQHVIERVEARLDDFNNRANRSYSLSLSIGVSQYSPEDVFDLQKLLAQADKNMYRAKAYYNMLRLSNKPGDRRCKVVNLVTAVSDETANIEGACA